jgi:hypothetical protein
MSKRNLFRELAQGIDEMRCFDQDKRRCARTGCGQAHALCGRCHDCRNPRAAQRFARSIRADACRVSASHAGKLEAGARQAQCSGRGAIVMVRAYPDTLDCLARF